VLPVRPAPRLIALGDRRLERVKPLLEVGALEDETQLAQDPTRSASILPIHLASMSEPVHLTQLGSDVAYRPKSCSSRRPEPGGEAPLALVAHGVRHPAAPWPPDRPQGPQDDPNRADRDVGRIAEEVLQRLTYVAPTCGSRWR
jgi:hypothetical protein